MYFRKSFANQIILVAIFSIAGGLHASADPVADCSENKDPKHQIASCTKVIDEGGDIPQLTTAFKYRGAAYLANKRTTKSINDLSLALALSDLGLALALKDNGIFNSKVSKVVAIQKTLKDSIELQHLNKRKSYARYRANRIMLRYQERHGADRLYQSRLNRLTQKYFDQEKGKIPTGGIHEDKLINCLAHIIRPSLNHAKERVGHCLKQSRK